MARSCLRNSKRTLRTTLRIAFSICCRSQRSSMLALSVITLRPECARGERCIEENLAAGRTSLVCARRTVNLVRRAPSSEVLAGWVCLLTMIAESGKCEGQRHSRTLPCHWVHAITPFRSAAKRRCCRRGRSDAPCARWGQSSHDRCNRSDDQLGKPHIHGDRDDVSACRSLESATTMKTGTAKSATLTQTRGTTKASIR